MWTIKEIAEGCIMQHCVMALREGGLNGGTQRISWAGVPRSNNNFPGKRDWEVEIRAVVRTVFGHLKFLEGGKDAKVDITMWKLLYRCKWRRFKGENLKVKIHERFSFEFLTFKKVITNGIVFITIINLILLAYCYTFDEMKYLFCFVYPFHFTLQIFTVYGELCDESILLIRFEALLRSSKRFLQICVCTTSNQNAWIDMYHI